MEDIRDYNQLKMLKAFADTQMSSTDMLGTTGYGLWDTGRAKLEQIFAEVMGAEDALAVSYTHLDVYKRQAQTGAVAALSLPENKGKLALFGGIKNARFRKQVTPGDVLTLQMCIRDRGTTVSEILSFARPAWT